MKGIQGDLKTSEKVDEIGGQQGISVEGARKRFQSQLEEFERQLRKLRPVVSAMQGLGRAGG
jgi:hypothetical protein